jgi:hypothetical protein
MDSLSDPCVVLSSTGRQTQSEKSTLLFVGDFYLRPEHSFKDPCDLFAPAIVRLIQQSTISIVNFEGTLAPKNGKQIRKEGPHLALDQRAPTLLKAVGFQGISLANNHAMDYGVEGLQHTLQISADCGLYHVGAGFSSEQAIQPLKVCLPLGVRLQVVSLCEREFGASIGNTAGTAWLTSPQAEDTVAQAKHEGDVVVVCTHGGNELMPLPSTQRQRQLRRLIDAGADLIIGHHPHVPQGWEQYAGRYIFYSLGDFYFDSLDGQRDQYRDWGFMVRVHLEERRIKMLELVPYERVQDKIVALGGQRNIASHFSYLEQLSRILAGSELEGYWQQLAVNRLSEYRPFVRGALAYSRTSFRGRVKEILGMGRDLWNLVHFTKTQQNSYIAPSWSPLDQRALGCLNVIRCDSHRWAIETALAVLTGECQDLRTDRIKKELEAMDSFYGGGDY